MAGSERKPGLVVVHSQSNRPDAPLNFNDPREQAFDGRGLMLPHVDLVVTSTPIEPAYLDYMRFVLGVDVPKIITPPENGTSLSASILGNQDTLTDIRKSQQMMGKRVVLSVFDPTANEQELLHELQRQGTDIISEVNFEVAQRLGNKAGFREFCQKYNIPQLLGGVFKTVDDLQSFVMRAAEKPRRALSWQRKDQIPPKIMIKHPNGTAGQGIDKVQAGSELTDQQRETWRNWIQGAGAVIAELFHNKVGAGHEHAVHIYIDPVTYEAKVTGIYDQLTKEDEPGKLAHYGAKYPMENRRVHKKLLRIARKKIIPALLQEGYTGPACFDVLSGPLHFMELNTRAGANYYAHREVEQVAQRIYGQTDLNNTSFMFLASLEAPDGETSFEQFYERYNDVLTPQENGTLILTNPSRHRFGKFDFIAYSPYGLDEAKRILHSGLVRIWGEQKAAEILGEIHTTEKNE